MSVQCGQIKMPLVVNALKGRYSLGPTNSGNSYHILDGERIKKIL